ncbi:hypothetical protein AB4320_05550 [Vibrio splendidus]
MNDRASTHLHNVDILLNNGFKKYKNTTLFFKGDVSIISPAVALNQSGGYWFDLRKVNLERLTTNASLLVRIVPNLFVLAPLPHITELVSEELMGNRVHSGDVWALGVELSAQHRTAQVFNKFSSYKKQEYPLMSVHNVEAAIRYL